MTQTKHMSPADVMTQLLTAIPRRLFTITAGVSGVSFAFGVLAGVLGYRVISRRTQAKQAPFEANYEAWTKAKLYEVATDLDLTGRGEMSKDELIEAVRSAAV